VDVARQVKALSRRVERVESWEDALRAVDAVVEILGQVDQKSMPRVVSGLETARIHLSRAGRFIIAVGTGRRLAVEALAGAVAEMDR
jgi:hypothetical protein